MSARIDRRERIAAGIVLAVLLLPMFLLILAETPAELSLPGGECSWLACTGHPCAGCGMTRALLAFFHGRPLDAFRLNLLLPFCLFLWGYSLTVCGSGVFLGRRLSLKPLVYGSIALVVLALFYCLLRQPPS